MKGLISSLIVSAIALYPLYIFDSGGLQLSTIILLFALILCRRFNLRIVQLGTVVLGLMSLWFLLSQARATDLKPGIIVVVNLLIAVLIASSELSKRQVLFALLISVSLVIIGLITQPLYFDVRFKSYFNNPNQLAYWAILALLLFEKLGSKLGVFACFLISLFAVSRGALLFLFVYFVYKFRKRIFFLSLMVAICLGFLYVASNQLNLSNLDRLNKPNDISFAEERALDRILLNPYGLITGTPIYYKRPKLGESPAGEVHNSLGNLIYDGGIVFLLSTLLVYLIIRSKKSDLVLLMIVSTYGLGHTVFRFPFFWITFALLAKNYEMDNTKWKNFKFYRKSATGL